MRLVIQRVSSARVEIDGEKAGSIGRGLVVLAAARDEDTREIARRLALKVTRLRIFGDSEGKMNLSVIDLEGAVLVVPQFTLYADTRKGNRPSFVGAARPELAQKIIEEFVAELGSSGIEVAEGRFGAHMDVTLTNDGPVTIVMDD